MEIRRVITRLKYDCIFDLNFIETNAPCVVYRTRNFNAVTLCADPSSYCQIFANGKCILNGGRSEKDVDILVGLYSFMLQLLNYNAVVIEQNIVNIVATYKHLKPVHLYFLCNRRNVVWEPELFPAAKYRIHDLGVTVNIFASGKCVLLGAKNEIILYSALQKLRSLLLDADEEIPLLLMLSKLNFMS